MTTRYAPTTVSHPGTIIAEYLASMNQTQLWLAKRMNRPYAQVNRLVRCHINITADTALQLESVLKRPAHFWMNLQSNYSLHLARQKRAR